MTNPDLEDAPDIVKLYVHLGSGIRSVPAIALTAKIKALPDDYYNFSFEGVNAMLLSAPRYSTLLDLGDEGKDIRRETFCFPASRTPLSFPPWAWVPSSWRN